MTHQILTDYCVQDASLLGNTLISRFAFRFRNTHSISLSKVVSGAACLGGLLEPSAARPPRGQGPRHGRRRAPRKPQPRTFVVDVALVPGRREQ